MTTKNRRKSQARALQEETGWSYARCLDLLDTKTPEEIDVMVAEAKANPPTKTQKARAT